MSQNKSPGVDGLPVEAYDENWKIIGNDLLTIYEAVLDTGRLGGSQHQAIITLIPKSNHIMSINNYRPISLLCVDYKILSKLLSERLKRSYTRLLIQNNFVVSLVDLLTNVIWNFGILSTMRMM